MNIEMILTLLLRPLRWVRTYLCRILILPRFLAYVSEIRTISVWHLGRYNEETNQKVLNAVAYPWQKLMPYIAC